MKEYDRLISTQVTKFIKEIDNIEEKALIYLQLEESIIEQSEKIYDKNSEAMKLI